MPSLRLKWVAYAQNSQFLDMLQVGRRRFRGFGAISGTYQLSAILKKFQLQNRLKFHPKSDKKQTLNGFGQVKPCKLILSKLNMAKWEAFF